MRRHSPYRGFEVWLNEFKMSVKMYWLLSLALGCVHLLLVGLLTRAWLGELDTHMLWHWLIARAWMLAKPDHLMTFLYGDQTYEMTAEQLARYLQPYMATYVARLAVVFVATGSVYLTMPVFVRWFGRHAREVSGPKHIRGARLADLKTFKRELRKTKDRLDLPVGEVRLPVGAEVKHMLLLGRTGVGKSVALGAVIERLIERGERGVVYDFKGDYTSRFFRPGTDIVFNPLDSRCVGWNLFNDMHTQMDVDALAASLIPRAYHADPYWNDAARAVFTGILHHLYASGARDNASIWEAVSADLRAISKWLKTTAHGEAGYTFIQDAGSKQALSVISVVMQYARPFEYLAGVSGTFSVVDWLNRGQGCIFVTNYSDIQDTLRPILSLFVDLLGRKLLAMPDAADRRVFFLLDEFGTLQRLPTIVNLLTLSRSKGGSVWIGIQDVGQIDKIYTKELRQTIVNACGNSLLFGVADPDTAKFLSEKIAETEYLEMDETYSMGPSEFRDGVSLAQRKKKEPLVLPSELLSLPDLTAYLKVGGLPLTQTTFRYRDYPVRQPHFALRDDLRLDAMAAGSSERTAARVTTASSSGTSDEAVGLSVPFERERHLHRVGDEGNAPAAMEPFPEALSQDREASLGLDKDEAQHADRRARDEENLHDALDPRGQEKDHGDDGSRSLGDGFDGMPFQY